MDSKNEIPLSGITNEPEKPSLPAVCVISETVKFESLLPEELLCFFAQLTVRKIADSMRANPPRILSALMRIKSLFSFNCSLANTTYWADNNFCAVVFIFYNDRASGCEPECTELRLGVCTE